MRIQVVYASQTGTSQDIAYELTSKLNRMDRVYARMLSISEVQVSDLCSQTSIFLFLVSTTGEGDVPDTMTRFWDNLLDASLPKNAYLQKLRFAVFGFGDTKYGNNFNVAARKLERRLLMLGAQEVVERCLGDQQDPQAYRSEYMVWQKSTLQFIQTNSKEQVNEEPKKQQSSSSKLVEQVRVTQYTVQRKDFASPLKPGRTTFIIEFLLPQGHIQHIPGDVLEIYPQNPQHLIKYCLSYFQIAPQQMLINLFKNLGIKFQNRTDKLPAIELFTHYINLTDTVPFFLFQGLHNFTSDQIHSAKLLEFAQNYAEYSEYARRYRKNFVQLLEDFPTLKIPIQYFLAHINPIRPRRYSIASYRQGTIRLLLRLVEYNIDYKPIKGVASTFLYSCAPGSKVRGRVLTDKFSHAVSTNPNRRFVCIGVGTGIAPFLSFAQYSAKNNIELGTWIIFGTKNQSQYFERASLQALQDQRRSLKIAVAYSQQEPKTHVQDLLRRDAKILKEHLAENKDHRMMVCGPNETFIENVLQILRSEVLEISKEQLKSMRKDKTILVQYW